MQIRRLTAYFAAAFMIFSAVTTDIAWASSVTEESDKAGVEAVDQAFEDEERDTTGISEMQDGSPEADLIAPDAENIDDAETVEGIDDAEEELLIEEPDSRETEAETYDEWNAEDGLTLNANGGYFSDGKSIRIVAATREYLNEDIPTRDGYAFVGWYASADCKEDECLSHDERPRDLANYQEAGTTIYAGWTDEYYTITFEMGDEAYYWGGNDETRLSSVTYLMPKTHDFLTGRTVAASYPKTLDRGYYFPNEALIMPLDPHYTFGGYEIKDENGQAETVQLHSYTPETDEVTLYVKLVKDRKVITYHAGLPESTTEYYKKAFICANGRTVYSHTDTETVTAFVNHNYYLLPPNSSERRPYSSNPKNAFVDWYLLVDGELVAPKWYGDSDLSHDYPWQGTGYRFMKLDGDIDLYPKWEETNTVVTFDPNDEDAYFESDDTDYERVDAPRSFGYPAGSTPTIRIRIPKNDDLHKRFTGWYTNPECSGDPICEISDDVKIPALTTETTYYAGWEDVYHLVTFDPNGGLIKAYVDPVTYTRVENAPKEDPLTYVTGENGEVWYPIESSDMYWVDDSKAFLGWFTEQEGGTQIIISGIHYVTEDTTYYAQWKTQYKLTLNAAGGRIKRVVWNPETQKDEVVWEETVTQKVFENDTTGVYLNPNDIVWWENDAISDKYEFIGWLNEDGTEWDSFSGNITMTSDRTLTAAWRRIYKITYNANGGKIRKNSSSAWLDSFDDLVKDGNRLGNANYVSRQNVTPPSDKIFQGWYKEGDESQALIGSTYIPTDDMTLLAKYIPKYTVTFKACEGCTIGGSESVTRETDSSGKVYDAPKSYRLVISDPTMLFEGWYLEGDENQTIIDFDTYIPQGNETYIAKLKKKHTVTFDGNGGTFKFYNASTNNYPYVSSASLETDVNGKLDQRYIFSIEDNVRPADSWAQRFIGWFTQKEGGRKYDLIEIQDMVFDDDITFYAHYSTAPKVTFDAGEGTFQYYDLASPNLKKGNKVTYPVYIENGLPIDVPYDNPVLEGADFVGWYLNGVRIFAPAFHSFTADATLYAHYKYRTDLQAGDVRSSVASGTVPRGTLVSLYCDTPNAVIYYTTDGSIPDPAAYAAAVASNTVGSCATKLYENEIPVNQTVTITALATREKAGNVCAFSYTVDEWGDAEGIQDAFEEGQTVPQKIWFAINGKVYAEVGEGLLDTSYTYNGSKITFNDKIEVYDGTTRLVENRDYTVAYANNTNAADRQAVDPVTNKSLAPAVTINGKGNYSNSATFRFSIDKADLNKSAGITSETIIPVAASKSAKLANTKPAVSMNGKKLTLNKDYVLKYYRGENANTADLISDQEIAGIKLENANETYCIQVEAKTGGNFTGKIEQLVKIRTIDGTDKTKVAASKLKFGNQNGKPIRIAYEDVQNIQSSENLMKALFDNTEGKIPFGFVYVNKANDSLMYGEHYSITLSDDDWRSAGVHGFTITGKENYVGTKSGTYEITGISLGKVKIAGLNTGVEYAGRPLTIGDLYMKDRTITAQNRDKQNGESDWNAVTLYTTSTEKINGKTVTRYHALRESTDNGVTGDYLVSMENTGMVGKFNLTFTGINGCTGTIRKPITIKPYQIAGDKIDVKTEDAIYTKAGAKPAVEVIFAGQPLKEGIDYTLSYKNNTALGDRHAQKINARPKVVVKGIGNYAGTATGYFSIFQANIFDAVTVSVPDVAYYPKGKSGYFLSTPKLMDGDKAIQIGKNKDVDVLAPDAIQYYYAGETTLNDENRTVKHAGDPLQKNDALPFGTLIRVSVTVSISADKSVRTKTSPYQIEESQTAVLTGYYRFVGENKDISKANVKLKPDVTYRFQSGSDSVAVDKNDIEVSFKIRGQQPLVLDPDDFEIVSVVSNRAKKTVTVTLRGRGEYGGLKTVSIKVNISSL
ncbi:MAG: InlB B-repeat-containing protein [Lachnospiraceae bacterium]|nr:InlB B-repeat-containing protein [Lachnospiraceae bacterium]